MQKRGKTETERTIMIKATTVDSRHFAHAIEYDDYLLMYEVNRRNSDEQRSDNIAFSLNLIRFIFSEENARDWSPLSFHLTSVFYLSILFWCHFLSLSSLMLFRISSILLFSVAFSSSSSKPVLPITFISRNSFHFACTEQKRQLFASPFISLQSFFIILLLLSYPLSAIQVNFIALTSIEQMPFPVYRMKIHRSWHFLLPLYHISRLVCWLYFNFFYIFSFISPSLRSFSFIFFLSSISQYGRS